MHQGAHSTNTVSLRMWVLAAILGALCGGCAHIPGMGGKAPLPDMVRIIGGTIYGVDPDFGPYVLPQVSFEIDRCEITKAQWDAVASWSKTNGFWYDNPGYGKGPKHPVCVISWYDCVKWCNARSEMEGRTPVYYRDAELTHVYKAGGPLEEPYLHPEADGYRLPTMEQWEYAARGGVENARFPWGGGTIRHGLANYRENSHFKYDVCLCRGHHPKGHHPDWDDGKFPFPFTSPVGSFAAGRNHYGLYDMAGNVQEWCYDRTPRHANLGRMVRGGSWDSFAEKCRAGDKGWYPDPLYRDFRTGLRTVVTLQRQ